MGSTVVDAANSVAERRLAIADVLDMDGLRALQPLLLDDTTASLSPTTANRP